MATTTATTGTAKSPDVQHFDSIVVKLVEVPNWETGEPQTIEVMSDNLYPGETLKRDVDAAPKPAK